MTTVTKKQIELYQVRHNGSECWGDIALNCGEKSVHVMIDSDFGSWSYYWSSCGMSPKEFLCKINFDYCMKKLTGSKHYINDPEQYPNEVRGRITQAQEAGWLTETEVKQALDEMLEPEYSEGDLYFHYLYNHELFDKVFGDYECLPSAKKISPRCQDFWDHVWIPFIEQLKTELKIAVKDAA